MHAGSGLRLMIAPESNSRRISGVGTGGGGVLKELFRYLEVEMIIVRRSRAFYIQGWVGTWGAVTSRRVF